MKFRFFILLFACLFLLCLKAQSHENSWYGKTFDNVRIRIGTGKEWEEIRKCFIIGELAAQLSRELNYEGPILLSFGHRYLEFAGEEEGYYSINIGKGKANGWGRKRFNKYHALKKSGIIITQSDVFFEAGKTLQLLEYAIQNVNRLKQSVPASRKLQIPIIASMDSISYLKKVPILQKQPSDKVKTVLQTKIYEGNGTLNYYYQDDSFHFVTIGEKDTTDLIRLKNVLLTEKNIVFDTDTSFYYLDKQASTRHTINLGKNDNKKELRRSITEFRMSINVQRIRHGMFGLSYHIHDKFVINGRAASAYVDCYSIYFAKEDYFAQDIEHLLLEQKNKHN